MKETAGPCLALSVLVLLAPELAWPAMYRCADPSGNVVFTDSPAQLANCQAVSLGTAPSQVSPERRPEQQSDSGGMTTPESLTPSPDPVAPITPTAPSPPTGPSLAPGMPQPMPNRPVAPAAGAAPPLVQAQDALQPAAEHPAVGLSLIHI